MKLQIIVYSHQVLLGPKSQMNSSGWWFQLCVADTNLAFSCLFLLFMRLIVWNHQHEQMQYVPPRFLGFCKVIIRRIFPIWFSWESHMKSRQHMGFPFGWGLWGNQGVWPWDAQLWRHGGMENTLTLTDFNSSLIHGNVMSTDPDHVVNTGNVVTM